MTSDHITDDIPTQMKTLNMVIPILMHLCSFISIDKLHKPHVIKLNVMLLMTSNYLRCLSNYDLFPIWKFKLILKVKDQGHWA